MLIMLHHVTGYENLQDYFFGPMKKAHKFCKTCGSSVMIDFLRDPHDPRGDCIAMNVSRSFSHVYCCWYFGSVIYCGWLTGGGWEK